MLLDSSHRIQPSIFRAYDIRGIVGKTLTTDAVFLIGKAIGSAILELDEHQLAIGRDGRLSGEVLKEALSAGILETGCDVIDIGRVPTPLLYYATKVFDEHSGVMITGSHNPPEYNGLKFVVKGGSLTENDIKSLYHRIIKKQFHHGHGSAYHAHIIERYINYIANTVRLKNKLSVVIDAGNGIASIVAPALFRALGCEVHELFCEVDGNFPNHDPDPSQPENLKSLIHRVREKKADVGLAFDGDGDRLGMVTNQGEIIYNDRLLMLFAKSILEKKPKAKIVYDVKCTHHLNQFLRERKGIAIMCKTGHSFIKNKLAETGADLGGEMSGHFFFKDRWFGFDDGMYAGARLLEILSQSTQTCDEIFATFPNSVNTPELKVFVDDEEKFDLMAKLKENENFTEATDITTLDGLRINFIDGWGLVRPSNTTPCLILRFEAINQITLEKIQMRFREWMLGVKPDLVLPF